MAFPWAAAAVSFVAVCLSGCASIVSGTSQEIKVVTNPPGANCQFVREGAVIASVNNTPGGVTIKKTKHDITLKCNKEGYQEATYLNHSGADGATFGNIILGGGIGWAIDSASGWYRASKFVSRHKLSVALVTALSLGIVASSIVSVLFAISAEHARYRRGHHPGQPLARL